MDVSQCLIEACCQLSAEARRQTGTRQFQQLVDAPDAEFVQRLDRIV